MKKYLLTAGKFCKKREIQNITKASDDLIAEEFKKAVSAKKHCNMTRTLAVLTNYIIDDLLKTTGLLYSKHNNYVLDKVQHLFWEWKAENLINDFNDFSEATKSWIMVYA